MSDYTSKMNEIINDNDTSCKLWEIDRKQLNTREGPTYADKKNKNK